MAQGQTSEPKLDAGSLNSHVQPITYNQNLNFSVFRPSKDPCDAQQARAANLVRSLSLPLQESGTERQRRAHGHNAILSPHGYLAALVVRESIM